MDNVKSYNLDHLGIVAGFIDDCKIVECIDELFPKNSCAKLSHGEIIKAQILNGLGFVSRPLMLSELFFENKDLNILFDRDDILHNDFNRHKIGRVLDDIHNYGSDLVFAHIAKRVIDLLRIDKKVISLDTTTFEVHGAYENQESISEIKITHGYSKSKRFDLKQVVQELITTHDGGIPLFMKCFDGNASDTVIFKNRIKQIVESFDMLKDDSIIVADSKLYIEENMDYLKHLKFVTRMPSTFNKEQELIKLAHSKNAWQKSEENKYFVINDIQFGAPLQFVVVKSQAAKNRSKNNMDKKIKKEEDMCLKMIDKLKKKSFNSEDEIQKFVDIFNKKLNFKKLENYKYLTDEKYLKKGRPLKNNIDNKESKKIFFHLNSCDISDKNDYQEEYLEQNSCFVLVSNANLNGHEVINLYKNQNNAIERSFRFLKDPQFFADSFFVKKTSRLMSILMIMTLSLLVFSCLQRKIRQILIEKDETIPNQIKQPIKNPTMRWIFQLMEGVHVVYIKINDEMNQMITGLNELRIKIITLLGEKISQKYKMNV